MAVSPLLASPGFARRNRSKSENKHLALADRQFGKSLCTILSNSLCYETIDKADCKRIFQIGDRRVLSANSFGRRLQNAIRCAKPHHRKGWRSDQEKYCEASADRRAAQARQRAASREDGVVFRFETKGKPP